MKSCFSKGNLLMKNVVRYLTIAVAFYLGAVGGYAQSMTDTLSIQAKQTADAMLNKDYETVIRFTHPSVVEAMGGFQKALAFIKTTMSELESKGGAYEAFRVGRPSAIVREGQENVAIVPTEMEVRIGNKRVRVNSYLVAVTRNRGKNWYFLDGAEMPKGKLAQMYPNLAARVEIPEHKTQVISGG